MDPITPVMTDLLDAARRQGSEVSYWGVWAACL